MNPYPSAAVEQIGGELRNRLRERLGREPNREEWEVAHWAFSSGFKAGLNEGSVSKRAEW